MNAASIGPDQRLKNGTCYFLLSIGTTLGKSIGVKHAVLQSTTDFSIRCGCMHVAFTLLKERRWALPCSRRIVSNRLTTIFNAEATARFITKILPSQQKVGSTWDDIYLWLAPEVSGLRMANIHPVTPFIDNKSAVNAFVCWVAWRHHITSIQYSPT